MIVGITGTRKGVEMERLQSLLDMLNSLGATTVVHGGCHGVDTQAHAVARQLDLEIEVRPGPGSDLDSLQGGFIVHERKPYLVRNRDIVRQCDELIALPASEDEVLRSGTWATVRYAHKVGKLVHFIF